MYIDFPEQMLFALPFKKRGPGVVFLGCYHVAALSGWFNVRFRLTSVLHGCRSKSEPMYLTLVSVSSRIGTIFNKMSRRKRGRPLISPQRLNTQSHRATLHHAKDRNTDAKVSDRREPRASCSRQSVTIILWAECQDHRSAVDLKIPED